MWTAKALTCVNDSMASPVTSLPLRQSNDAAGRQWLSDFAPDALPETPDLTAGQRRVLQACLVLFADQGFAGSSIRDIAAAAGLQPASLYNHFASKEAMLTALLLVGNEHHTDYLLSAVLASGAEPRSQMQALVRAHVRVHCEYSRLALIVNREEQFLPGDVQPQVAGLRARSGKLLADILERGARGGSFTPLSATITMLAIAGLGLDAARWFPYQSDVSAEGLGDIYTALTMRMLGAG